MKHICSSPTTKRIAASTYRHAMDSTKQPRNVWPENATPVIRFLSRNSRRKGSRLERIQRCRDFSTDRLMWLRLCLYPDDPVIRFCSRYVPDTHSSFHIFPNRPRRGSRELNRPLQQRETETVTQDGGLAVRAQHVILPSPRYLHFFIFPSLPTLSLTSSSPFFFCLSPMFLSRLRLT